MATQTTNLAKTAAPFLDYLDRWYAELPSMRLEDVIADNPDQVVIFCVDMINGFANEGPLASPRVDALSQPIASFLRRAYDIGVRNFVLFQDSHTPDAVEFGAYPPHAIQGTSEAETVADIANLSFAGGFEIVPKNALTAFINTTMTEWLDAHPEVRIGIIVGDCTDLCVYQNAMHMRMRANALDLRGQHVIVPANLVDTFDLPVEVAGALEAQPHPGDFHHVFFLHHMAQNGIQIVRNLE